MISKSNKLESDPFWRNFPSNGSGDRGIRYYPQGSDKYRLIYSTLENDIQLLNKGDTIELDSSKLRNYESISYEGWYQGIDSTKHLIRKGQKGNPNVFFISDDFYAPIVEMKVYDFLENLSLLREQFPYYWVLCLKNRWIFESRFAGRLTRGEFNFTEEESP